MFYTQFCFICCKCWQLFPTGWCLLRHCQECFSGWKGCFEIWARFLNWGAGEKCISSGSKDKEPWQYSGMQFGYVRMGSGKLRHRWIWTCEKYFLRNDSNFEVWGNKIWHGKSQVSFLQHVCFQFENLTSGNLEVLCWIQIGSRGWADWTRKYFFINNCLCLSGCDRYSLGIDSINSCSYR